MQLRLFTETLSLTPKQWVQGKALFLQEETLSRSSKQNLEGQKRGGEERRGLKAQLPIPVKQHSGKVLQVLQLGVIWNIRTSKVRRSLCSSGKPKLSVLLKVILK